MVESVFEKFFINGGGNRDDGLKGGPWFGEFDLDSGHAFGYEVF